MRAPPLTAGPPKRILVASPVEPSGASWLLNCFLELGIKIGHKPVVDNIWRGSDPRPSADHIWVRKHDDLFELNRKAAVLTKFLPILARQTSFRFRGDVAVEYVQDFPPRSLAADHLVLMIRDPRDSIYSLFRRIAPRFSFEEFLRFPNPQTLLDRPAHWALFVASWLARPDVHIVRFEDYKRDAGTTLRSAIEALDLHFDQDSIAQALHRSSFESAREAERIFRERFPGDVQIANRAGQVGEGRGRSEVRPLIEEIERATATVLAALEYQAKVEPSSDPFAPARLSARFLSFFETVALPAEIAAVPVDLTAAENMLFKLLAFAHRLDADLVDRAAMSPDEARKLHDSLAEFIRKYCEWSAGRIESMRADYSDGSAYFFNRIREMRQASTRTNRP